MKYEKGEIGDTLQVTTAFHRSQPFRDSYTFGMSQESSEANGATAATPNSGTDSDH